MAPPATILENRLDTGSTLGYSLLVMGPDALMTLSLPVEGSVTVGRAETAEVRLADPLASRFHARLHIGHGTFEIEDLGSINKTRVRDVVLQPSSRVAVHPGEAMTIGSTVLMVQQARDMSRPRRIWPHVYFEARLEEECARSNETIHRLSPRAKAPLVCVNCAALSENLLESELFGHERGAFTGATEAKAGLLETAPGGTILLDEIGEMPLGMQAKLLRVIETKQVTRVGGLKPRAIDVRFLAATNRNLEAEAAAGRFRSDLYFRLNGLVLQIPPLRERPAEILALARMFARRAATGMGLSHAPVLTPEAEELLLRYAWPGNIRELRNVMERAVLLCTGGEITTDHLPGETMLVNQRATPAAVRSVEPASSAPPAGESERDRILRVLAEHAGNQSRAAKTLGIARSTLVEKLDAYNIPRPRKPAV